MTLRLRVVSPPRRTESLRAGGRCIRCLEETWLSADGETGRRAKRPRSGEVPQVMESLDLRRHSLVFMTGVTHLSDCASRENGRTTGQNLETKQAVGYAYAVIGFEITIRIRSHGTDDWPWSPRWRRHRRFGKNVAINCERRSAFNQQRRHEPHVNHPRPCDFGELLRRHLAA